MMEIFVTGVSYRTAPVALRERVAVTPSRLRCTGCHVKMSSGLSEVVLVSTCNRVEVYGVTENAGQRARRAFDQLLSSGLDRDMERYRYIHQGEEAIRHLFSVASGLDSMVIGETEITGQIKHAYESAREVRLTGRILNRVFQKALQTAKEIRTHTSVGRGATSVGSVAVELAEKIFGPRLTEKTVMIIGAGKMGEACVRHLAKKGVCSVLVSNRSYDRACELAKEFSGQAIRFDGCVDAMGEADIVVSSTGCPQTILHRPQIEAAMKVRRNRPLILIDIAVPRDIAPEVQNVPEVFLYNIDDLEAIVRENMQLREQELSRCRAIIRERTGEVVERLEAGRPAPVRPSLQPEPVWPMCQPAV